jgi:hypothetical protein
MASTYSSNIGIELITEGEQAGAWGTTTNGNWSKAEEATSSYSTVTVTSTLFDWTLSNTVDAYTPSTASTTGSTGRALFVEFISNGGDPSGTATINIRGNGTGDYPDRVFFAKNGLTGTHDIILKCGSGDDFTLKHNCVAAVYTVPDGTTGAAGNIFSKLQTGGVVLDATGVIVFEGTTENAHETTLEAADPSGDRTISLPDATDTLVGKNTADVLTNKTLTLPVIASISNSGTVNIPSGADTLVARTSTDTLINKTLTSPVIDTAISGTAFLTSTNMVEDSATKVASQQSIKAYVDAQVTAQDLDIQGDSGVSSVDLDSQTLDIAGGTDITTEVTAQTATVSLNGTIGASTTGNAGTASKFAATKTIAMTGDVAWTSNAFDGSANATGVSTIQPNSVDLGSMTTGNYIQQGNTAGTGLSGTVNSSGGTFTVTLNSETGNVGNAVVIRDGSGNFSAGVVTAALLGNASSANTAGTANTVTDGVQSAITSAASLATVGNLNSGSITSGFTGIDVGASPIDGGIITADTRFAGPLTGNVTGSSTEVVMSSSSSSLITNYVLMGVNGFSSTGSTTPNTSTDFTYTPNTGVLTGATEISAKASDVLTLKGTGVTITPSINTNIDCNTTGTGYVDVNRFKLNNAGSHSVTPVTSTTYGESYLIGEQAGGGLASGVQGGGMICIGDNAGRSMTSGTQRSIFIGNESGYESTKTNTGHSCIGIGYQSLKYQDGTPSGNIGIGFAAVGGATAAAASTTGGFNVGIGYTTLSGVTSGVGNVQVGRAGALSPTSGSGNTLIGNLAASSSATVDSEIVIGELCVGQGTNTCTIGKAGAASITINYETQTSWSHPSDAGVKKNISDSSLGLTFINALRPVTFNFKQREDLDGSEPDEISAMIDPRDEEDNPLPGKTTELISGFIAQEVKAALDASGTASVANSGWSQSPTGVERLASGQFVMPLVKAVQELSAQVAGLEARLAVLE